MRSAFSYVKRFFKDNSKTPEIIARTGNLYVAASPIAGRGVFSFKPIRKGQVIERCPVLVLPLSYLNGSRELVLNYYAFILDREADQAMISLGYGSLYNHACPSNSVTKYNDAEQVIAITAVSDIAAHEEITINYFGEHDDNQPIDFWKELNTE